MIFDVHVNENVKLGVSGLLDPSEHLVESLGVDDGFGFGIDDELLEFILAQFLIEGNYYADTARNCQIAGCPLIAGITDDGDALAVESQLHKGSSEAVNLLVCFLVCDGLEGLAFDESLTESDVVSELLNGCPEHLLKVGDGTARPVDVVLVVAVVYHIDKGLSLFHFHFFDFLIFHLVLLFGSVSRGSRV